MCRYYKIEGEIMKKIISFFCIFVLFFSLCGCDLRINRKLETADFSKVNCETPNYNNYYDIECDFLATEDFCIYAKYGDFDNYIFAYHNGEKIPLLSERKFKDQRFNYDFFLYGNDLYFSTYSYDNESYENLLYKYSLTAKTYEQIFVINEEISSWKIAKDYIVYIKHYDNSEGFDSLYCYNLSSKEETLISNEIEQFGIVNGNVQYITKNSEYTLNEYDLTNHKLKVIGTFKGYSSKEYTEYNFTPNGITMFPYTINEYSSTSELSFFNSKTGTTSKLILPEKLYELICCDEYAYAVCYTENSSEDEDDFYDFENNKYSIYRINLINGDFRFLDVKADYYTSVFVDKDDEIYIMNYDDSFLSRKTIVTKYDLKSNKMEELFNY